jgi:Flp pilus assembly protein TadD
MTEAALITLSSAQERAGDPKGSEESLRRILTRDPNNATALNNLGYFLVERNERLTEALEMIQRAVRSNPTNSSFLDSLGWAYFKLGKLDEAERHLTEAARRNTTSVAIQEHLGDVYQRRGKLEMARAAWQKALSLVVVAEDTARIKAKLGSKTQK